MGSFSAAVMTGTRKRSMLTTGKKEFDLKTRHRLVTTVLRAMRSSMKDILFQQDTSGRS